MIDLISLRLRIFQKTNRLGQFSSLFNENLPCSWHCFSLREGTLKWKRRHVIRSEKLVTGWWWAQRRKLYSTTNRHSIRARIQISSINNIDSLSFASSLLDVLAKARRLSLITNSRKLNWKSLRRMSSVSVGVFCVNHMRWLVWRNEDVDLRTEKRFHLFHHSADPSLQCFVLRNHRTHHRRCIGQMLFRHPTNSCHCLKSISPTSNRCSVSNATWTDLPEAQNSRFIRGKQSWQRRTLAIYHRRTEDISTKNSPKKYASSYQC